MSTDELQGIIETEQHLERLLVASATDGVPEVVLISILRDYADLIEDTGYVPRTWRE